MADGKRTIAAEARAPGRSGYCGPATEMPSTAAAAHAAEVRSSAAHAAKMATAGMAATAKMTSTATMTTTAMTAAAASGCVGRAGKRDRKHNH
jgi:hypothetical protein